LEFWVGAARNASPAPHTVSVEARVGTPRFLDETAQQVTWLAKNGIEHAEIRVKPAELGPISVRIEMQNNEAVISFAVTQPETRVAVEDALHRLQEMLAESGISMGETSVGGQSFGQQLRDDREAPRSRNVFASPADMHATALEGMGVRARVAARGLVDTFA
jgi:flagellar hook-length control protein FliK